MLIFLKLEPPIPDVSSYLIGASMAQGTLEEDRNFLEGDTLVLLIVGRYNGTLFPNPILVSNFAKIFHSDSMATTLINIFHNLARHPIYQQQIRSELKNVPSVSDFVAIQELPILKSVIKETLRLWPPVPTGSGRKVPKGGLTIAGQYIPAETVIFAPRYTIARRKCRLITLGSRTLITYPVEDCFERASEFVPERWNSKPEMVKNKRAYEPFSFGWFSLSLLSGCQINLI
jgi:tryprostatin B 6-hydroxylase